MLPSGEGGLIDERHDAGNHCSPSPRGRSACRRPHHAAGLRHLPRPPRSDVVHGRRGLRAARWRADPTAAFGAEVGGELVGSNFATNWGSVGFFGPLTIRPDLWDRGVGKRLMEPVMECFARWGTAHAGLFTFAHSQKHVGLYQRFGFWPRFLTAIMSKPVEPAEAHARVDAGSPRCRKASERRPSAPAASSPTTSYEGLDVSREISAVATQKLGDTVLLWEARGSSGWPSATAGRARKPGAGPATSSSGRRARARQRSEDFDRLLEACEDMASQRGLSRLVAGVNTARHEAYRAMLERGFRTDLQGVAMHRPTRPVQPARRLPDRRLEVASAEQRLAIGVRDEVPNAVRRSRPSLVAELDADNFLRPRRSRARRRGPCSRRSSARRWVVDPRGKRRSGFPPRDRCCES